MKKLFLSLLLLFVYLTVFATTEVIGLYTQDFGNISRLVITLSKRSDYSLRLNKNAHELNIEFQNTQKKASLRNHALPGNVFNSVSYENSDANLLISVATDQIYSSKVKESGKAPFRLILDVFNVSTPSSQSEYEDFIHYAWNTGQKALAETYYAQMKQSFTSISSMDYLFKKKAITAKIEKKIKEKKAEAKKKKTKESKVEPKKIIEPKKEKSKEQLADVKKTAEVVQKKEVPAAPPVKDKKNTPALADTSNTQFKQYLKYYQSIPDTDTKLFLVGIVAHYTGDNPNALLYLKQISQNSPIQKKVPDYLYDIYMEMGDTSNAKLIKATTEKEEAPKPLAKMPVLMGYSPNWVGIVGTLLGIFITWLMTFILFKNKLKRLTLTPIKTEELAIHEDNLVKAYEKYDTPSQVKDHEPDKETTQTEESIPSFNFKPSDQTDIETEEGINYEKPPILAEELDPTEEEELLRDEKKYITFLSPSSTNDTPSPNDDDLDEGFADDEYKRKMILKLHNDGWDIEEIAKELQVSQREIEFTLKVQQ